MNEIAMQNLILNHVHKGTIQMMSGTGAVPAVRGRDVDAGGRGDAGGFLQMNLQPASMFAFFPALLQDRREVLTATIPRVTRTLVEGLIWPFSLAFGRTPSSRLLLNA
jgi:hypothetical protein